MKVAFIGLGVMGYPMAGHLQKAEHEVTVYNRTVAKADQWVAEFGGTSQPTPAQAAAGAEIVFGCVGNDDDLAEVTTGPDGAFQSMTDGAIFVDHTTASANIARQLYETADKQGVAFIDAPVSGGEAGAQNGQLTIMCGGDQAAYDKAEPVMAAFARASRLMGPVGSGQLTKMVNQITIAGLLQSLSEAVHFAQQAGLDGEAVFDVISKGAAQSWQMENRASTMLKREFDFGFAVDWMRKDLAIALDEAKRNGASLPVAELIDGYYADVQALGGGRWDTSSLVERLIRAGEA
ncbi:unnamed protein product [Symbiodinium microadriaticum]|nr:unnamed protein product [Symbiodinium microadriaticum]